MKFKKLLSFAAACAMAVTSLTGAVTADNDSDLFEFVKHSESEYTLALSDVGNNYNGAVEFPAYYNYLPVNSSNTMVIKNLFTEITYPDVSEFHGTTYPIIANQGMMFNKNTNLKKVIVKYVDEISLTMTFAINIEDVFLYCSSLNSVTLVGSNANCIYHVINEEVKTTLINAGIAEANVVLMSSTDPTDPPTPSLDYTSLNKALSNASQYQETAYTEDSYKALSDAVAAGEVVKANIEANQTDVDNAAQAINNAIANLKLDYTALDNAIANGEAIDTSIYIEATVTTLTNAITAGKAVLANTEATAADFNNAVKAINDAIAGLKKTPPDSEHTSAFLNALNKYRNVFDTDYTEESYAQYKVVLDKMLKMDSDGSSNYTNEEIDAIISEIEAAYNKLELKLVFDYTELETAVANAKKITDDETSADKYMPESYQYLLTKLEKGEALLADKNAETHTQSDINATTYEINYAIDHLEAANKAELFSTLQDTITKAEALDKDKYTAESFVPLTEALATAKAISAESSLADIVSAQEALDSASEGLVFNQTTVPAGEPFGYIRYGWTSTPFLKGVTNEEMAGATQIRLTFDCAADTSYNSYFDTPIEANIGGTVSNFAMKASTTAENLGEENCTAVMPLTAPVEAGQSYTLTGYTYGYASAVDYIFAIKKIEFMDSTGYILGTVTDKTIAKDNLAEAISKAEAIDTANYTDESVAVLTAAIEAAKALTDEATAAEINEAVEAIEAAVKGLVGKPTDPDPTKPDPSKPDPTNPTATKPTTKTPTNTTRSAAVVAKDKEAAKKAMKQAKITKLTVKSRAKKKITVTWKKVKKAIGYEVQVSTNKKFKKSKIIIKKLTSKKKLTIKNKKIKSGKKYFVRVRAYATYKDANGTAVKVYSNWNKKLRTVKTK